MAKKEEWLSVTRLAGRFRCSEATIHRWKRMGCPGFRMNGQLREGDPAVIAPWLKAFDIRKRGRPPGRGGGPRGFVRAPEKACA